MRRYSEAEKSEILKEVESLGNVSLVSKKRGISHTTIHAWIKKGLKGDRRNYSAENRNLRKRISDLELKNEILKELLKKSHQVL